MTLSKFGRRWWLGLILLGTATTVVVAYLSRANSKSAATAGDSVLATKPGVLAPGVYILGRAKPSAVYAVDTSDGLVLVDSGLDANAKGVIEQLAELGLDLGRLKAILLTHCHADHSQGAAYLKSRTGAKIYAGHGDSEVLRDGEPRDAFVSIFYMPSTVIHPTPVDVELGNNHRIDMGDTRFTAIAAPGHTPGSICYLMERAGTRFLFTGDLVLSLSPENPDPLGTYAAYLPPCYRGDATDFRDTLRRLRAMPAPDMVLPGHPIMDPTEQNPRLPRDRWRQMLDGGIDAMNTLLVRRKADGANFLDGNPKQLLPGLFYLGDCEEHAIYALKSSHGVVIFDAPGSGGLVGFLETQFQRMGWELDEISAVVLTSLDADTTSGLDPLVTKTGCRVVAPSGGLDAARGICPAGCQVVSAGDFEADRWLDMKTIPLGGLGISPTAYLIQRHGKSILVSGRIPTRLTPPVIQELMQQLSGLHGNWIEYVNSLERLRQENPDLWLPAVPIHGQTANLYDREWHDVIDSAEQLFRELNPQVAGRSR